MLRNELMDRGWLGKSNQEDATERTTDVEGGGHE
jgi:hypothetical protein